MTLRLYKTAPVTELWSRGRVDRERCSHFFDVPPSAIFSLERVSSLPTDMSAMHAFHIADLI